MSLLVSKTVYVFYISDLPHNEPKLL